MSDRHLPKVTGILQKLMNKASESPVESPDVFQFANSRLTGLGVPVIKQNTGQCFIDMSGIKIFSGVIEFVRVLMGRFAEEYKKGNAEPVAQTPPYNI